MKYPALLSASQALQTLDTFDSIIDVRSETEFALDHVPGAINCPVLHDEERVRVGTIYKQSSAFEAKKIGAALVASNIAEHLQATFSKFGRDWKPLVYCWRGGNRSGAMAHILAKIGWAVTQLDGGYREYRQQVLAELETLPARLQFRVVCGTTGSGKSRLLETLAANGEQVLDLEKLAAHRGSLLGRLPDAPQPTQKMFESQIWRALSQFSSDRLIFVESESKKIGNLRVPEKLMLHMRLSPCLRIDISTDERVKLLIEDYPHLVRDTGQLLAQLEHLTPLHGHEKIRGWRALAESGDIPALVKALLEDHYDPAYLKSIGRNFEGYKNAVVVGMPDITAASFSVAAAGLTTRLEASGPKFT